MKTPRILRLLALPALAIAFSSVARADVSAQDKMFVQKAAGAGMFEVQSSQLALDKDSNADVKDFANMMVTDHSKANDQLKSIASSKDITVPTALDPKHQKMLDSLQGKSGDDFQKEYLMDMTKGHKAADMLFMKEAGTGSDPDLKSFATTTDQTIKHHIAALDALKEKVK